MVGIFSSQFCNFCPLKLFSYGTKFLLYNMIQTKLDEGKDFFLQKGCILLSKKDNLVKGDKYNEIDFLNYLKIKGVPC